MAEDLEVERGGQLYVASFTRDELRAVDHRAVVSCVEEVVDIQLQVQRLRGSVAYDTIEDRATTDLVEVIIARVEATRVSYSEAELEDTLRQNRSVVEGPCRDLVTWYAFEAIASGNVIGELAGGVAGNACVGEGVPQGEVEGLRGRIVHLQLETLADRLPDGPSDLTTIGSCTEVATYDVVQRDVVGCGME